MAAVSVNQFSQCITCHAWSPDHSMIAFCPNNSEVHIYQLLGGKWEKIHVLQKHDQIVSGLDWGVSFNRIVTVAHDRNSYVWSKEASEWVPTLVILRLNRAALCVQWSPKENKFAAGSGAKTVCICYYEQENNWWVSKIIRKRHDSSVTSVAWHPNNILLATTSTDGKCRVFSTFIKGVDVKNSTGSSSSDSKFGEQIMQLDLSFSWTFGMKWSPHGNTLAYVGHNSMIYFVDDVGPSPSAQSVTFRDLPLRDVLFVSERMLIGVGFDCNPMVFAADERGLWSFLRFLDETKPTPGAKYGSQRSGTFGKFSSQSKNGSSDENNETSRRRDKCITSIVALKDAGDTTITSFSTSVGWQGNHMGFTKGTRSTRVLVRVCCPSSTCCPLVYSCCSLYGLILLAPADYSRGLRFTCITIVTIPFFFPSLMIISVILYLYKEAPILVDHMIYINFRVL